jgi:alpha-tubulin suppressor-like RCC1 family protein
MIIIVSAAGLILVLICAMISIRDSINARYTHDGFLPKYISDTGSWTALPLLDDAGTSGIVSAAPQPTQIAFLRDDATWAPPPIMTGATVAATGTPGSVPQPLAGQQNAYLRGDGTWQQANNAPTAAIFMHVAYVAAQNVSVPAAANSLFPFNTTLSSSGTAGIITPNMPVYTKFTLAPGYTFKCSAQLGYNSSSGADFAVQWQNVTTGTLFGTVGDLHPTAPRGQLAVGYIANTTAGPIVIALIVVAITTIGSINTGTVNNYSWATIEVVGNNNTVTQFAGATATSAGALGYVPAPPAGAHNAYLRGDGTWAVHTAVNPNTVARGGYIAAVVIVNGGTKYDAPPTITITPPATGIGATATAIIANGIITAINITNAGWGYTADPIVAVSTTTGTPAIVVAYAMVTGLETYNKSGNGCGNYFANSYIMSDGSMRATGHNNINTNGIGDSVNLPFPVPVLWQPYVNAAGGQIPTPSAVKIWKAYYNTYVLGSDGYLYATGLNHCGCCGTGNLNNLTILTRTLLPIGLVKFSCSVGWSGGSTPVTNCVALLADGSVWVWGWNNYGELGQNNTTTNVSAPIRLTIMNAGSRVLLESLYTAVDVYMFGQGTGGSQCFILLSNGQVMASGNNNSGQLANGSTTQALNFGMVLTAINTPLTNIVKVAACGSDNWATVYYLTAAGTLFASGANNNGQCGIGNTVNPQTYAVKCLISGVLDVIACGNTVDGRGTTGLVAALTADGLYMWGINDAQILPGNIQYNSPTLVWGTSRGTIVKCCMHHHNSNTGGIMILLSDGRIYYNGSNSTCSSSIVGLGNTGPTNGNWMQSIFYRRDIVDVTFGGEFNNVNVQILTATGEVYSCGCNNLGQLGNGGTGNRSYLSKVMF